LSRGKDAPRLLRQLAAALAAAVAASACQGSHLRLVNEGDPGPLFECDGAACEPARAEDPTRKNREGTDFYVLPEGCVELRSALLDPAGPALEVVCGLEGAATTYRCEKLHCDLVESDAGDGPSTWPIELPAECGGRIHELIVLDARTDHPKVYVECDASSGPLGEM
jgi:hypothetical protein